MRRTALVFGILMLIGGTAVQAADAPAAGTLAAPHVAAGPPVDGTLRDPLWQSAAVAPLGYDLTYGRAAAQTTTVYLLADDKALYVAFDAHQKGEIVATQHTDNVGFDTDDEVQVDLWPSGSNGVRYLFTATPNGTHYAHSTENAVYEPAWTSAGTTRPGGYTVTMRIPFDIMRGDGRASWNVQLIRFVVRSNEKFVWTHAPGQRDHNDVVYAGALTGLTTDRRSTRPKPRLALFGLGEAGSRNADGVTSRAGADIALPVTPSASFIATIHPDYSNVETDQQTISPSAYARYYNEVRPFFTQGSSYYNPFDCDVCPGVTELYTPNIPTPRRGYALEGTQGPLKFAAFDAVGESRDDLAQTLSWKSPAQTLTLGYQGVTSTAPGFADRLETFGIGLYDRRHWSTYLNYGFDRGSNVLDTAQAQRIDLGAGYASGNDQYFVSLRKIGRYYNPADGLIQSPDVAGYALYLDHVFRYGSSSPIKSFDPQLLLERYHGADGRLDRTTSDLQITLFTKTQFRVVADTGSEYFRLPSGVFAPITQAGICGNYLYGTSTPSGMCYNAGRYGDGRLQTWNRNATFKLGTGGSLAVQADDTFWSGDAHVRNTQWLERVAFSRQFDKLSSLAVGVRKIVGFAPPLTGPQPFVNASNISVAYSRHTQHDEIFLVYGDSSLLTTKPAVTLKYVWYLGGQKGT